MQQTEYANICNIIINDAMQRMDIAHMLSFDNLQSNFNDAIYNNAVCDNAPITLVYTPSGSGKSSIITDRINALQKAGIKDSEMLVLNLNIAKTIQMQKDFPDANCLTFSEFPHYLFDANFKNIQATDLKSTLNALKLLNVVTSDKLLIELIRILSLDNQKERTAMLILFARQHTNELFKYIETVQRDTCDIESILCHQMFDVIHNNPFDIKAILINGIHNMPVHVLCCLLLYASRYHCNLFITGEPREAIYDFKFAYNNAMNVLSASPQAHVIRLPNRQRMTDDIANVLERRPCGKLNNIKLWTIETADNIINDALDQNRDYISNNLANHSQTMIIARKKQDIADIKAYLEKHYPTANIADITVKQPKEYPYGEIAVDIMPQLLSKYQTITIRQLLAEIYNISKDKDSILDFYNKYHYRLLSGLIPYAVRSIIDTESDIASDYLERLRTQHYDISSADIILSTIHASIDIRCDNVIIFIAQKSNHIEDEVYQVALSRANKSEHIIIQNLSKDIINPYVQYLTAHLSKK